MTQNTKRQTKITLSKSKNNQKLKNKSTELYTLKKLNLTKLVKNNNHWMFLN